MMSYKLYIYTLLLVVIVLLLSLFSCDGLGKEERSATLKIYNDDYADINIELKGDVDIQHQNSNTFTVAQDKFGEYTLVWYEEKIVDDTRTFRLYANFADTSGTIVISNLYEVAKDDTITLSVSETDWREE